MQHGIDRARTFARFEKRGGFGPAGFVPDGWHLVDRLAAYIPTHLDKPTQLNLLLRDLDPHELALVAIASLLHSALVGREDPEMTLDLGRAVHDLAFETKVLRPGNMPRKIGKDAMQARYRSAEWAIENEVQAGSLLLDFCLAVLPDMFELIKGADGVKAIQFPDGIEDEVVEIYTKLVLAHPVFVPIEKQPDRWTGWRRDHASFVTGVYHEDSKRAFRNAFRDGSMQPHLDGMHALESVAYRINTAVLGALRKHYPEILEAKFHKKQLRLEDKRKRLTGNGLYWISDQIKAHARQFKQDKRQFKLDLAEAERHAGAPFYLPLRCDFRGRVYPLPYFHYQRGEHLRALFLFDRGEAITERGIERLKDYTASRWGQGLDKKTLFERRQWCDKKWPLIERTARQEGKEWLQADDPFLFLAACTELVAAVAAGPNYITHLPIAFDGLANGLVHYCCLTRQDPTGLLAAGSTATPAVDPYMAVAKRVDPDNPDRALAKQPTQQYVYGATGIRRAEQIREALEDRDDFRPPADPKEAARLFYAIGEYHRRAIEGEFLGVRETMEFLQEIARTLAKRGEPLRWSTPTGFPLINRYHEPDYKIIESVLRDVRVRRKIAVGYRPAIKARKSRDAAAANVVHALDAAHMMLVAIACQRADIDIMGIHDCYVCLASQADTLNEIIRQELVRMYEQCDPLTQIRDMALQTLTPEQPSSKMADTLAPLAKRIAAAAGIQPPDLPNVPERGSFDLREIINNVYIFSS
jgi:Autographiviridae RNA polymerase